MFRSNTGYVLEVIQDPITNDHTSMFFEYSNGMLLNPKINVDEGSDWYLISSGDHFNSANIAAGLFPVLISADSSTVVSNVIAPPSTNFLLGFNTGASFADQDYRSIFGWVYLSDRNGELTLVKSAITYNDGGIIVEIGEVPLPASALLLASSLLSYGFFVKKHNKKRQPMPTAHLL